MSYKILKPEITNVPSVVWAKAKTSWVFWIILIVSAFFALSSMLISLDRMQRADQFGLLIISLWPILFPLTYLLWVQTRVLATFWKEVAEINGWQYKVNGAPDKETGVMFQQGDERNISNYIEGAIGGRQFRMFNYWFSTGSGKSRRVYFYIVFAFKFNGSFPHIYLNNKHNSYSINIGEKIPLPSEFEDKFILSTPREYEIEALEIFTEDVFAKLLDEKFSHDVEFVDHEVLMFVDGNIDNFEKLEKEFNRAMELEELLDEKLDRFKFEKIGDRTPDLK